MKMAGMEDVVMFELFYEDNASNVGSDNELSKCV